MSDRFENELRDHLHREAQEIREFPRSVRGRIREGIAPKRRAALVPQLALAGALVILAGAVLIARSPQVVISDVRTAVSHLLPTPAPTPEPFLCEDRSGGSTGLSTQLTAVRVASHESDGYDRVVFDFSGGIPSYDLTRQASAAFVREASGEPVQLDGNAGLKLVFRDADPAAAAAPTDLKPGLASIHEVTQLGAFERVLTYGIGLSSSQCVRLTTLSGPSRLVVDVATTPSASTTAAPTPVPTASQTASLPPFACQDFSGGTAGDTMQLTAVRSAHQPGYDRLVFEFAAPNGSAPHIPTYTVTRQASATFVKDPSGIVVTMRGSNGLRIVFHGATAAGTFRVDVANGLPVVQEVGQLGDFESVLSWGAGLSRDACIRTVELTSPVRLVVDVQTP